MVSVGFMCNAELICVRQGYATNWIIWKKLGFRGLGKKSGFRVLQLWVMGRIHLLTLLCRDVKKVFVEYLWCSRSFRKFTLFCIILKSHLRSVSPYSQVNFSARKWAVFETPARTLSLFHLPLQLLHPLGQENLHLVAFLLYLFGNTEQQ